MSNAKGIYEFKDSTFLLVDIPGTYSIMSNSQEEEIARNYICFSNPNATIIVVDATCLERNLNLVLQIMEITDNVIVCVNLLDEAKKKNIHINLEKLSNELGVPVVGTIAHKKKTLNNLMDIVYNICMKNESYHPNIPTYPDFIEKYIDILSSFIHKHFMMSSKLSRWISIKLIDGDEKIINSIESNFSISFDNNSELNSMLNNIKLELLNENINNDTFKDIIVSSIVKRAENISTNVCTFKNSKYSNRDRKLDKILTSKTFGIPIMLLFLGIIFWITIVGANYPSSLLSAFFGWIQTNLLDFADYINIPSWISNMLILGVYQTLTWVISVMLPPMAIFFPLFTFLEDLGYLPRIAFNMDGFFKKCCCSGKQMITMCMGMTRWEIFLISHFVFLYLTDLPEFYRNTIFYYIVTCKDNF